jgi:hypothetical protein
MYVSGPDMMDKNKFYDQVTQHMISAEVAHWFLFIEGTWAERRLQRNEAWIARVVSHLNTIYMYFVYRCPCD